MAQNPDNIVAVAAMIRPDVGDPYCIVRWSLGASGSELPHRDDVFDVALSVGGVEVARTSVQPKNYAMIDPSRREVFDLYPSDPKGWWVAKKPTAAINPADSDTENLAGKAVGIAHLLGPTATPRLRFRAARTLFRAFEAATREEKSLDGLSDIDLARSAVTFANILIQNRIRPRHLPQLAAREFRAVNAGIAEPTLLAFGRRGTAQLAHSALVLRALSIPGVPERLEQVVEHSSSVREHIRLAGLQGGALIDYWDDPDNSGNAHDDAARGRAWPAAELIGCGCRIPVTLADLRAWAAGTETLKVTVSHRPRHVILADFAALAADRFQTICDIWLAGDRPSWGSVTSEELVPGRLKLALTKAGSSHPPLRPTAARVDWGMVRVELQPIKDGQTGKNVPTEASVSFRTGDAKIEICIDRPPSPLMALRKLRERQTTTSDDERTGAAYNVYGVWEGAPGFEAYFDDPSKSADLATLRPWLLTRRYSFAKDIKEAFPQVGGIDHPSLKSLIDVPAWHPLLKRPDQLNSETHLDTTTLPDVGGLGDAIFTFDLRSGMALPASARSPKGWDPGAPLSMEWRPELDRDLVPLPAQQGRPQRYRFWVTAVDAFEQESEPCPVLTHDLDRNEPPSTLFEPRRRSPLAAPPGGEALTCVYDKSAQSLTITFETPFKGQVSDQSSTATPTERVDATTLEARVVVFRRLLLTQTVTPPLMSALSVALPDLPQWRRLGTELANDRWRVWDVKTVAAPTSADRWSRTLTLGEDDLGWEYIAAVGMQVAASHRPFWAHSVVSNGSGGRQLTVIKADANGNYPAPGAQPIVRIDETPADSQISTSKPCVVGDTKAPWSPDVTAFRVVGALPISAPPGVRRDLILQRLISRGFVENGQPVPKVSWGDEDVTIGQAALSESGLTRTVANDASLPAPTSDAMAPARRILARDFRKDPGGQLRQHASIGFRGLACLEWDYTPRSKRISALKLAEAAAFRVYCAMAPEADQESGNFATVVAILTRVGTSGQVYSVNRTKGDDLAWRSVGHRPTLVAFIISSQTYWASVARTLTVRGIDQVELIREGGGVLPPGPADGRFFAAQPIDDVQNGGIDDVTSHKFFAPIPGGSAAWFAWWVGGVSAAGVESPPGQLGPMHLRKLPRSVEPPPVLGLTVRPGVQAGDYMNPAQQRAWMPQAIQTLADAKHFPRTVLTWHAPGEPLSLDIRRIEEQVARPTSLMGAAAALSAWEAILAIEAIADTESIDRRYLVVLADWLMGQPVQIPEIHQDYWSVFDPAAGPSADGVIHLDESLLRASLGKAGTTTIPAWVDYFGRNDDRVSAMDANWQFKYQLCTYVDLGVSAGAQRWLYSTPTTWSPFVIPDRPPIRLTLGTLAAVPTSAMKARIVFTFKAMLTNRLRAERLAENSTSWEYRVVVRRQLPSAGISENEAPWIDVGQPLRLLVGDPTRSEGTVYDEDVDRSWPGHRPKVIYRVFVQEFMELHKAGDGAPPQTIERLVRAYETSAMGDIQIALEPPTSETQEIEMRRLIEVS